MILKFILFLKVHLYSYLLLNLFIGLLFIVLILNKTLILNFDFIKGFLICSILSIIVYSFKIVLLTSKKLSKFAVKYQLFIFIIHFMVNIVILLFFGLEKYYFFSGFLIAYFCQILIFVITFISSKKK